MQLSASAISSFGPSGGSGNIGSMAPNKCKQRGGTPINCRTVPGCGGLSVCPPGSTEQICDCYFPPAPAVAPASSAPVTNVTVSPPITVSPQISPVMQQQYQPSGSPMTAGTQQAAAPAPAPAPVYTAGPAPAPAPYVPPAPSAGVIETGPEFAYPPDYATALATSVGAQTGQAPEPSKSNNALLFGALGVLGILLLASARKGKKNAVR